jgi:hypothetical protein
MPIWKQTLQIARDAMLGDDARWSDCLNLCKRDCMIVAVNECAMKASQASQNLNCIAHKETGSCSCAKGSAGGCTWGNAVHARHSAAWSALAHPLCHGGHEVHARTVLV